MKTAIIDLGSNTIRLSVYNTFEDGSFEQLFSKKEMAGLVGYIRRGEMTREGIEKACETLKSFLSLLNLLEVKDIHVFATASLRNITNTDEAVHRIFQQTGILVDVISGKLEANLGYYGALRKEKPEKTVLFDIGGGSTELVEIRSGEIFNSQSLSMGSLNLFSSFVSKIWPKDKEIEKITACIEDMLTGADIPEKNISRLYGIGGTARAVLRISNDCFSNDSDCLLITRSQLNEITGILTSRSGRARKLMLNHCPDRLHTIIPGILIMNTLADRFCCEDIAVSRYGVREGYLCHRILKNTKNTAGTI